MHSEVFVSKSSVTVEVNEYNREWSKCKVLLPSCSDYYGYYVSLSPNLCKDMFGYYIACLYCDNIYELIKAEREPGKRYARPKLKGDELISIFRSNEATALNNSNLWLAEVTHYSNRGSSSTRELEVGCLDCKSFYANGERHNVNSFGLTLLRPLDYEGKLTFEKGVAELKKLSDKKDVICRKIKCLDEAIKLQPQTAAADAEALLLNAYAQCLESIYAEMRSTQKQYYIPCLEEVEAARKQHMQTLYEAKKQFRTVANENVND